MTRSSDKPAPGKNNGSKLASNRNNNSKLVFRKNNGDGKADRFGVSKIGVKYIKK